MVCRRRRSSARRKTVVVGRCRDGSRLSVRGGCSTHPRHTPPCRRNARPAPPPPLRLPGPFPPRISPASGRTRALALRQQAAHAVSSRRRFFARREFKLENHLLLLTTPRHAPLTAHVPRTGQVFRAEVDPLLRRNEHRLAPRRTLEDAPRTIHEGVCMERRGTPRGVR